MIPIAQGRVSDFRVIDLLLQMRQRLARKDLSCSLTTRDQTVLYPRDLIADLAENGKLLSDTLRLPGMPGNSPPTLDSYLWTCGSCIGPLACDISTAASGITALAGYAE